MQIVNGALIRNRCLYYIGGANHMAWVQKSLQNYTLPIHWHFINPWKEWYFNCIGLSTYVWHGDFASFYTLPHCEKKTIEDQYQMNLGTCQHTHLEGRHVACVRNSLWVDMLLHDGYWKHCLISFHKSRMWSDLHLFIFWRRLGIFLPSVRS